MPSPARHPFPPELFLVAAVAAPVVEYAFRRPDCASAELAAAIAASGVPCLALPALLYVVYRWVVPIALPARWRPLRSLGVHLPLVAGTAAAGALAIRPVMSAIHPRTVSDPTRFLVIAVAIAVALILPVMLFQDARRARDEAERRARQERQARLEAQFSALQARTSPHFLFNTLNTVASLIHDDPDLAEATLERLSSLFRYALEGARAAAVPIERELAVCEDYLEIQAARFGDRFSWRIELDPRARGAAIAPLTLQPLVENAVVHGVGRREKDGHVDVVVAASDRAIVCTVTDNGAGAEAGAHPGGGGSRTSLEDLRARLTLLPGSGALATERLPGGGFRASVVVPRAQGAA